MIAGIIRKRQFLVIVCLEICHSLSEQLDIHICGRIASIADAMIERRTRPPCRKLPRRRSGSGRKDRRIVGIVKNRGD
jgi:hypothetical protein